MCVCVVRAHKTPGTRVTEFLQVRHVISPLCFLYTVIHRIQCRTDRLVLVFLASFHCISLHFMIFLLVLVFSKWHPETSFLSYETPLQHFVLSREKKKQHKRQNYFHFTFDGTFIRVIHSTKLLHPISCRPLLHLYSSPSI